MLMSEERKPFKCRIGWHGRLVPDLDRKVDRCADCGKEWRLWILWKRTRVTRRIVRRK
jgi:hypothetical protein